MKHLWPISCVVLLVLGCAAFAQTQDESTVQFRALDALGNPVPKAIIQTWVLTSPGISEAGWDDWQETNFTFATTDDEGSFTLSEKQAHNNTVTVRLFHPDYGMAEARFDFANGPFEASVVHFALVKKGTVAEKNALRGTVVDPENRPVAGARVRIFEVTAPDYGVIQGMNSGAIYTDKAGRFNIYPVEDLRRGAAKEAVVPKSTYVITVVQETFTLFPYYGIYKNSDDVVIKLDRPELAHHFLFMGPDGRQLSPEEVSRHVNYIEYRLKNGSSQSLPARLRTGPVKLMPGHYETSYYDSANGLVTPYQAVEVIKDSPEELIFRFPPQAPVSRPSPATTP